MTDLRAEVHKLLERQFTSLEDEIGKDSLDIQVILNQVPEEIRRDLQRLSTFRHNARGILLTLSACKSVDKDLKITHYKADFSGGFDARGVDTAVVVPFLNAHDLVAATESHWLTRSLAQEPYERSQRLRTGPAWIGIALPKLVCVIDETDSETARCVVRYMLACRIGERDKGKVPLTIPKNISIQTLIRLLDSHFNWPYKQRDRRAAPRLPQLAIYAIYQDMMSCFERYNDTVLAPLQRIRSADRKAGTIGDIDVLVEDRPFESVEVKFREPISSDHVETAIQKIQALTVERYFILSTGGVNPEHADAIEERCKAFFSANGCEIIVNGVLETISYYLRILEDMTSFLSIYLDLVAADPELTYEHRQAWNSITSALR